MEERKEQYTIEDPRIYLHPSVSWLRVGDDKIQVRTPAPVCVTFDEHRESIEWCLEKAESGLTLSQVDELTTQHENFDSEVIHELIDFLTTQQVFQLQTELEHQSRGVFNDLADFHVRLGNLYVRAPQERFPVTVEVHGEGVIASLVGALAKEESCLRHPADATALEIVCSDHDNYRLAREKNREIFARQNWALFVRWSDSKLVIGPLVVPSQGACFECFYHRKHANVRYEQEFFAHTDNANDGGNIVPDSVFESFVQYVVGRTIGLILKGALGVFSPGKIERYDPVSGEQSATKLLKLPMCDVCGRVKKTRALRAVRDLI